MPYKRLDVAVDAATRLGVPLKIVGGGPDEARLRARAGTTVEFLGPVEGQALRELYRRARALVLPGEEDFGIAPVEAMACGRPVIAHGLGGATETVVPGVTGVLVERASTDAFAAAMNDLDATPFDPQAIRAHAETFATGRFEIAFGEALAETLAARTPC